MQRPKRYNYVICRFECQPTRLFQQDRVEPHTRGREHLDFIVCEKLLTGLGEKLKCHE
jgi:hypothetical protein